MRFVLGLLCFAGCTLDGKVEGKLASDWQLLGVEDGQSVPMDQLGNFGQLSGCVTATLRSNVDVRVTTAYQNLVVKPEQQISLCFDDLGPQSITIEPANDVANASTLEVELTEVATNDCYDQLKLYQVDYEVGRESEGVTDPVVVTMPLNGVSYRFAGSTNFRDTFFMDCRLAVALARSAYSLRSRNIFEVEDIGVYNYRCIGGGTPDETCTPSGCSSSCSLSQHAFARGIDIASLTDAEGTRYSIEDDWVIDSGAGVCEQADRGAKDKLLHDVICEMNERRIWNVTLTPNYNAAHRNHWHVDLKDGSDFIERVDHAPVTYQSEHQHSH